MAGKMEQAKGRLKEVGDAFTGNERLKQEGKLDQTAEKAKGTMGKAVDTVKKRAIRQMVPQIIHHSPLHHPAHHFLLARQRGLF